jgi:serine/threonine protein kinase
MTAPGSVALAGRYALGEKIGAGGYREVWRGTDIVLARPVVIKPARRRPARRRRSARR